jgi:hypothetical protein
VDITPGRKYFDEHMAYIAKNDVDGLIDDQYAEDAFHRHIWREATRPLRTSSAANLTRDQFAETDESIFFQECGQSAKMGHF